MTQREDLGSEYTPTLVPVTNKGQKYWAIQYFNRRSEQVRVSQMLWRDKEMAQKVIDHLLVNRVFEIL